MPCMDVKVASIGIAILVHGGSCPGNYAFLIIWIGVITFPMSPGVIVRSEGMMLHDTRQRVHGALFFMGAKYIGYGRLRDKMIEAEPLVRNHQEVKSAFSQDITDRLKMPDQIRLVLDTMGTDDVGKPSIDNR